MVALMMPPKSLNLLNSKLTPCIIQCSKAIPITLIWILLLAFYSRLRYDDVTPVIYNFSYLLKACADNSDVVKGKQVHAQLILHGFSDSLFAMTSVVNLYAKCGMVGDAYKMFDRMPERDLVCWNTVISGYAQNGMSKRALELVLRMQEEGCNRPDSVTIVSILPACGAIGSFKMGKLIHGYVFRNGFESLVNVSTALVDMYAKCGSVDTARLVFDKMDSKTVVSLNAMIDGYARNGYYDEALIIFQKMLDEGFKPTNVTIMSTLHACAETRNNELGQYVHKLVNQLCLGSNVAVVNSLISMYCKCQRVDIAAELFENLREKHLFHGML
uniref:Putative pentatricopeptide repeat-containing protein-like n=1 Tax=Solanum chacoense TaxID=4108 RepID=A0A0V0I435_SOLCH